jgi:hypothetical protein
MDSFLKRGNEQKVVGAGADFQPSGLIAKWKAGLYYSFWTETDLSAYDLKIGENVPVAYRKMGRGWRLYFDTQDSAKTRAGELGAEINPQEVWRFETDKANLLNVPDKDKGNFGDVVSFEVEAMSFKSKKYGYKLQLISLPGAVAAYGDFAGWKDMPSVEFSDLVSFRRNDDGEEVDPFTDELFKRLCGDVDVVGGHKTGTLYAQRVALWAALGESDPMKFHAKYIYTADGNKAGPNSTDKLATVSDKLDEALGVLSCRWETWARIVSVKDPKPSATYTNATSGETKRLTIPVVYEFFHTEADARKAADAELKAREERAAAKAGVVVSDGPAVPAIWSSTPQDTADFKKYIGEGKSASELGITPVEWLTWRKFVGIGG